MPVIEKVGSEFLVNTQTEKDQHTPTITGLAQIVSHGVV